MDKKRVLNALIQLVCTAAVFLLTVLLFHAMRWIAVGTGNVVEYTEDGPVEWLEPETLGPVLFVCYVFAFFSVFPSGFTAAVFRSCTVSGVINVSAVFPSRIKSVSVRQVTVTICQYHRFGELVHEKRPVNLVGNDLHKPHSDPEARAAAQIKRTVDVL